MKYAENTTVPVEKTQGEIKALLTKHGTTHYAMGSGPEGDVVQFRLGTRHYRFDVQQPDQKTLRDEYIAEAVEKGARSWTAGYRADAISWKPRVEAEWRRRWRARLLWLKAQLEFASDVPIEEAMLANLVLPDGRTFGKWAGPQVDLMYETGGMPALLGDGR